MLWNEFIFSNERRVRVRRHVYFWLSWWFYFWLSSYFLFTPINLTGKQKDYLFWNWNTNDLVRSFCMLSIHIAAVYILLYFLMPKFLPKKRYFAFASGILVLFAGLFAAGYLIELFVFPLVDKLFTPNLERARKNAIWASADRGLLSAIKIMIVALVVKLIKFWWIKQIEKERLETEKLEAEVQLLRAQIRPDFLFGTLDNICQYAENTLPKAAGMLIQLSDLLSYMLYDCDSPKVKLEKEIEMLKAYIGLEKIGQGEKLDLTIQTYGELNGQTISPLVLLPFIDNSLSYCNKEKEQAWISIELTIEKNQFSMKLINGLAGMSHNEFSLKDVRTRLQLLYPDKHEIKINAEKEMLMVYLKLNLEETPRDVNPNAQGVAKTKPTLSHAGV